MSTETETMTYLSQIMELAETIDRQLSISATVRTQRFDQLTPELWAAVQDAQEENHALLELLKEQIEGSAKVVANDALVSHLVAVMTAD